MKFASSTYNVGYPVYGSKFLNDSMLLVAGGGGEGNNGIPNKLTVLRVDFEKKKVIKRFREITLDPNDDSPTNLDAANNLILMGCNENSEKIKSGGGNQNLRKYVYENDHLKFVASIDFDGSISPEDYTKLIYMSRDGSVGAIASSKVPTVIRIIDPRTLEEKYEIETGHDVKDMHFAPDGKVIGYITASTLEIISIVTGRFIIRKNDFDKNYILSKVRFLTDDVVLIAASLQKGNGVVLIKISLKSGSATVLKTKLVTNKFKGLTSMDVDPKNQLAVLAGNDNSMALVKLKDFTLGRMFKQVHSFAITRVAFSPDSKLIASVSAANTINVIKVPENFALSTSLVSKIWKLIVNFVLIVVVAYLGQLSYKYNLHERCYTFLKQQYLARRNGLDAGIDILKQTTLVGDIVSEVTTTRPFDTVGYVGITSAFNSHDTQVTRTTSSSNDNVWLSDSVMTSSSISTHSDEMKVSSTSSLPVSVSTHQLEETSSLTSRASKSVPGTQISEKEDASTSSTGDVGSENDQSAPNGQASTEAFKSGALKSESSVEKPTEVRAPSVAPGSVEVTSVPAAQLSTRGSSRQDAVEQLSNEIKGSQKLICTSVSAPEDENEGLQVTKHVASPGGTNSKNVPNASLAQKEEVVESPRARSGVESSHGSDASRKEATPESRSSTAQVFSESNSQTQFQKTKSHTEVPLTTRTSLPSSYAPVETHASVETEDDDDLIQEALNPSGAEIDFGSLEEKTPEPAEVLGADREITTPTDTLISAQETTNSDHIAPSEEVSLETGNEVKYSKSRPIQEAKNDGVVASNYKNEIEVHVEVPSKISSASVDPTGIESKSLTAEGTGQSFILEKDLEEKITSSQTVAAVESPVESYTELNGVEASFESDDELAKTSEPVMAGSGAHGESVGTAVASVKAKVITAETSVTSGTESASATTAPKVIGSEESTLVGSLTESADESFGSTESSVTDGRELMDTTEPSSALDTRQGAKAETSSQTASVSSTPIESLQMSKTVELDEDQISFGSTSDEPDPSSPSQSAVVYDEL